MSHGIQPLTNYGRDSFYYGAVSIGTKGQVLNVDIDTGSADLWVQSGCRDCTSAQFQPSKSKTFKKTTQKFSIQYGSGSASGTLGHDTVTIAGLTVSDQYFGLVDKPSSDFLGTPSSGLIGMAFSSIASSKKPTFFENLMMGNKGMSPFFSVYLTRTSTGAKGSQVCLGCYDRSKVADGGGITWLPVTSKTYWAVGMTGALVNKKAVVPPSGGSLYAAIDTGTTLIYVPNAFAKAIYAQVPGAYLTQSGYYAAPCESLSSGTIALVFSGQPFAFNINDFNLGRKSSGSSTCVAGILGLGNGFPSNLAIVGDEFLKSWYSTYDYSNGARVGLSLSVTAF
ncbi:acid protease [Auricularia subglabra TFB-10046 SS5]|nr:acid protease [Auricularia subglabra TFB-10046 SS5]